MKIMVRLTVAAVVIPNDAEATRQRRQLRLPHVERRAERIRKKQRRRAFFAVGPLVFGATPKA